jgi:hypothetical protein
MNPQQLTKVVPDSRSTWNVNGIPRKIGVVPAETQHDTEQCDDLSVVIDSEHTVSPHSR